MNTSHTAGRERRTILLAGAGMAILAMVLYVVVGQTTAAFTAQTSNPDNAFTTGSVTISDSAAGTALFNLTDMLPGHEDTQTITVTNLSTAPLGVRLFADAYTAPTRAGSELADHLELTIDLLDADDQSVVGNVFTGSVAEFVAGTAWVCGNWTGDTSPKQCDPSTVPGTPWGPLEQLVRLAIPGDPGGAEDAAPFDDGFWASIRAADNAVAGLSGETQPAADAWALVPQAMKDFVKEQLDAIDEAHYLTLEQAIADSPTVTVPPTPLPTVTPSPEATPEEKTYPELGDRLEEAAQADSARIYRIHIKLATDAGSYDIDPADSLSFTFVWEGRA